MGLILCTSKKRQHVELLLADGPHKMQVSEYLTQLPDKRVLEERLRMYGRLLENELPRKSARGAKGEGAGMRTDNVHRLTWVGRGRKVTATNPPRLSLDRRTRAGALFSEEL